MKIRIILLFPLLLAGCCEEKVETAKILNETIAVETVPAKVEEIGLPFYVSGTLVAKEKNVVRPKISGSLEYSIIELGKKVSEGETIARIKADEFDAKLMQAKSSYEKIERELKREEDLLKKEASTKEIVENLKDALNAAKAMLKESETYVSYKEIKSPMDGVITAKYAKVGDLAAPSMAICEIESLNNLQAKIDVPSSIQLPELNQKLEIESGGKIYLGKTVELSPVSDSKTRSREIKLEILNPENLRAGDFVKVKIAEEKNSVITIPQSSVSSFGQIDRVFVVENGTVKMRIVKLAAKLENGSVVVTSGLNGRETVIISPKSDIKDGIKTK